LPASAAQVFGPNTVDPDFTTTGEKTLLTMSTTLAAGGKNVIIVAYTFADVSATAWAGGTFRIKKGTTILYETVISNEHLGPNTYQPKLLIAVDAEPGGNDVYTFTINIAGAASATTNVHVQGLVVKADDAVWARNTSLTSVSANSAATILSLSTSFPANSKVVVIAFATGTWSTTDGEHTLIGAGNVRLKLGTIIVSSNQFNMGSYGVYSGVIFPLSVQLIYFTSVTTNSQTWSFEVNNPTSSAWSFYAGMVAFAVIDGAFLDTGSVSLTNGTQVTVGNLSTTLTGDVVAIGLGAAENPTYNDTTFNAGDIVLQRDNSTNGQIATSVSWLIRDTSLYDRAGIMPFFRLDTGATNPSYQIKMTAQQSGINGEAKILAFSLFIGVDIKKVFSETLQLLENIILKRGRFRLMSEDISIIEASNRFSNRFRYVVEQINLTESGILSRMWIRVRDETINVIDAFQQAISKFRQVLESLNILETTLTIKGKSLQFSEMLQISEAFTRVSQRFREVVEAINLNEALLISRRVVRVFGEFVNLLENIVMSRIINKVVNETERLIETFVSALGKAVGVIENVRIYESTFATRIRFRVINELVRISEAFSKSVGAVKSIVEQVNLLESFKALSNKFRLVGENVRIDEFPSLTVGKFRSFIETIRIGEVFNSFKGVVRQVVEVVNIGEVSSRLSNLFRSVVESVRVEEFVGKVRNMFIRAVEGVNVIESIKSLRILLKVTNELIEVGESFSSFMGRVKSVVENVRVIEALSLSTFKTYIKKLKSFLMGSAKGGEL
jgi:uncharacterized protein with HEPN domain